MHLKVFAVPSQYSIRSISQIIVGLFSKTFEEDLAEAYLEPSRTSTIESFCKNSYGFLLPRRFWTGF